MQHARLNPSTIAAKALKPQLPLPLNPSHNRPPLTSPRCPYPNQSTQAPSVTNLATRFIFETRPYYLLSLIRAIPSHHTSHTLDTAALRGLPSSPIKSVRTLFNNEETSGFTNSHRIHPSIHNHRHHRHSIRTNSDHLSTSPYPHPSKNHPTVPKQSYNEVYIKLPPQPPAPHH